MRNDYKIFFDNISEKSNILDIGCGEGDFLLELKQKKSCLTSGLEYDSEKVAKALEKGLSVIQGDADADMAYYPDNEQFDGIIIAHALQVMKNPREVLKKARKITKKLYVSTPNFAYYKNRMYLFLKGRMPVTSSLSYAWYETPNIHFSTIIDFIELAEEVGFKIEKSFYETGKGQTKEFSSNNPRVANIFGVNGFFVLK